MLTTNNTFGQCVKGDCITGEGTKVYSNGNKYEGNFKNGKRNGKGTFTWTSGAKYEGNWVDNKREGNGKEVLANGTFYIGSFQADSKHGIGSLYDKSNKLVKKGKWENGVCLTTNPPSSGFVEQIHPIKPNSMSPSKAKILNLGVGFGSFYGLNSYTFSGATSSGIPPVSISLDFISQKTDGLTYGAYLGYTSNNLTISDNTFGNYGWKDSYFILGARTTYAYNLFSSKKTVPYVSAMLGYNLAKSSFFGDDIFNDGYASAVGGFTYSGSIGLRHMFNNKTGAFAELGYGIAYLSLGASLKI